MAILIRGLVLGVAVTGVALGLASPASAELTPGQYTGTMLDAGASGKQVGSTKPYEAAPCGPDCMMISGTELHRQGNTWTGATGASNQIILDNDTLVFTIRYTDGQPDVRIGLTKNN
jgi:hypothetical protein